MPGDILSAESALFSESQGRILISVSKNNISKFEKLVAEISCQKLGQITKDNKLVVTGEKDKRIIDTNIKKLHSIYHSFSNKMS